MHTFHPDRLCDYEVFRQVILELEARVQQDESAYLDVTATLLKIVAPGNFSARYHMLGAMRLFLSDRSMPR